MKQILILVLLTICSPAHAQLSEPQLITKVLEQLQLKPEDCQTDLIAQRVMPYAKEKSVVIIPRIAESTEDMFTCDAYVVIVNNKTGIVQNKFYEDNAWTSNAIRIAKISIDFAAFKLNATTRAFGVKVLYEGSSRANPYENEEMSLFIPQGNTLDRVLNSFSANENTGEWDTNCEGHFVATKKILIMSEKKTNDFFDIIVKSKITTTDKSEVNGECKDVDKVKSETAVLHFNGKEYK